MYRNKNKLSIKQWQEDKKGKHDHRQRDRHADSQTDTQRARRKWSDDKKKVSLRWKTIKNAIKKTLLMIPNVYNVYKALLNI